MLLLDSIPTAQNPEGPPNAPLTAREVGIVSRYLTFGDQR